MKNVRCCDLLLLLVLLSLNGRRCYSHANGGLGSKIVYIPENVIQNAYHLASRHLSGTNQWLSFNKWTCSAPAPTQDAGKPKLAALYKRNETTYSSNDPNLVKQVTMMLVVRHQPNTDLDEMWIYSFSSHTWRTLKESDCTKTSIFVEKGKLITVCKKTILWFGDNDICAFNGELETWHHVMFPASSSSAIPTRMTDDFIFLTVRKREPMQANDCNEYILAFNRSGEWRTITEIRTQSSLSSSAIQLHFQKIETKPETRLRPTRNSYPKDILVKTAVAATSHGLVFVMASCSELWQYDVEVNSWRLLADSDLIRTELYLIELYQAGYFPNEGAYVLFMKLLDTIFVFDLERKRWTSEKTFSSEPSVVMIGRAALLPDQAEDRLFLYNGIDAPCQQDLYALGKRQKNWVWRSIDGPSMTPPQQETSATALVDNSLYVLSDFVGNSGFTSTRTMQSDTNYYVELWELNLSTMRWNRNALLKLLRGSLAGDVVHGDVLIFVYLRLQSASVIGYNISKRQITQFQHNADIIPTWRDRYSLISLNSSSLLLCGGVGIDKRVFHDVWVLTVSAAGARKADWHNVSYSVRSTEKGIYPLPRYDHTTVLFNGTTVILLGGYSTTTGNSTCSSEVWHFVLSSKEWLMSSSDFKVSGQMSSTECIVTAVSVNNQVIVTTQVKAPSNFGHFKVWIYLPGSFLWAFVSQLLAPDLGTVKSLFWSGRHLLLDTGNLQIFYTNFGCPGGFSSPNITSSPCRQCTYGQYSTGAGESECSPCPSGLTTRNPGGSSIAHCSNCVKNYCKYGTCVVLQGQEMPMPSCQCIMGFTGDYCQYPTYYLITVGVLVFLSVAVTGVVVPVRIWKKKKVRERLLRNHVDQLNSVWQIKENEVQLHERIGRGGYGEVYRASYREMTVAVKIMHLSTDRRLVYEFEREIVFMQTIRHAHIVMFFGAGRLNADDCPFLVIEYMPRGSVRDLLDDQSLQISQARKMSFALDAAKGMEFLHGLNPPRVHRDFKGDNLLVSQVKVAWVGSWERTVRLHKERVMFLP